MKKTILAVFLFISFINFSMAQENKTSLEFKLFEAKGVVVGEILTFGERYEKVNNIKLSAPFSFVVPKVKGMTPLFVSADNKSDTIFRVHFTTGDKDTEMKDREIVENIQFVPMSVPMGEGIDRLELVAKLLANKVFDAATASYEANKYLGTRQTKIGDYDAIEVFGKYIDPENGFFYLRIVGILNPNKEDSIFVVSNIKDKFYRIASLNDLALTTSGIGLSKFKYISE